MSSIHRALAAALLAVACASGGAPSAEMDPAADAPTARTPRRSANLITTAEIEAAPTDLNNAFDLVQRLRPSMMRFRNQSSGTSSTGAVLGPVAYVDQVRLGAIDLLRTVTRASVREIRFLSPTEATTRWGSGHASGVVQVLTKH